MNKQYKAIGDKNILKVSFDICTLVLPKFNRNIKMIDGERTNTAEPTTQNSIFLILFCQEKELKCWCSLFDCIPASLGLDGSSIHLILFKRVFLFKERLSCVLVKQFNHFFSSSLITQKMLLFANKTRSYKSNKRWRLRVAKCVG